MAGTEALMSIFWSQSRSRMDDGAAATGGSLLRRQGMAERRTRGPPRRVDGQVIERRAPGVAERPRIIHLQPVTADGRQPGVAKAQPASLQILEELPGRIEEHLW